MIEEAEAATTSATNNLQTECNSWINSDFDKFSSQQIQKIK